MGDFWVKIRSQWQGRSETGIHRGNSLSPQITSILIGKHGLGLFWPLPSFPRVHGAEIDISVSKLLGFETFAKSLRVSVSENLVSEKKSVSKRFGLGKK